MRTTLLALIAGLCLVVAAVAASNTNNPFKPGIPSKRRPVAKPVHRPVPSKPHRASVFPAQPIMSVDGLIGLHEVYVQPHVSGEAKWLTVVGTDQTKLKADVEARLGRISGLKVTQNQSPLIPHLLVQVVGHTIPGYHDTDPPAASHLTLAVMQPVVLARRGPANRIIQSSGITYHATVFSTGKASVMRARVKEKVASLLDGFEKDYLRANPKPGR